MQSHPRVDELARELGELVRLPEEMDHLRDGARVERGQVREVAALGGVDGRDARVDVDVDETVGSGAGDVASEVRGAGDVGPPGGARASPRVVDDGASCVRATARREHREERREHERDAHETAHRRGCDAREVRPRPWGASDEVAPVAKLRTYVLAVLTSSSHGRAEAGIVDDASSGSLWQPLCAARGGRATCRTRSRTGSMRCLRTPSQFWP